MKANWYEERTVKRVLFKAGCFQPGPLYLKIIISRFNPLPKFLKPESSNIAYYTNSLSKIGPAKIRSDRKAPPAENRFKSLKPLEKRFYGEHRF